VRFRTRKHFALLVFLAVEPRIHHRRDRLADLLWPDTPHPEGRHSLATALSVIRGRLGPRSLETTRDSVRLVASDLEVDLERLERGDVLGDGITPPLEVAGFLEEFDIGRAPEYMFWRDLMRARLFPQIRNALALLMDRCRRSADFTRIEGHADRLLALDELNEDGIRAKMEARAFAGDRLSAIRIYQAWRERLESELGAAPSPLVEGIALRLRQRGYEPPGTSHIPTVPTDQWRNRAFVGRASQYRVLYERWEATNGGQARHGLVVGESGIGKTTLVERLVTAAGLEGAVSSRVQCYEVEREFPYAAIGTLMRGLLDRPGAGATGTEWLAELARFVPGVAERYPGLPPAKESAGESARIRLAEAVHELVLAVAYEHPLILVVDDVHLADDVSVAVLHLLMRRIQDQRVMVILTARQSELSRAPHAARLLEQQGPLGLELVDLPPLTTDEMNEMITALAQAVDVVVPPVVRRALLRASTGVPMLAELLFDDWRIHADECLALAVGAMTVDALGEVGREVYHRIFERVLAELSPPARSVLNLAAILGDRLNDLSMYELVDLTLAQTLTGMAELAGHRILRDGGREMEFRNELLRNYAYLNVPSPLRRALHGLIADRLLAAEARGERVPGLMMAWHCFRAGRGDDAVPHLIRGAREAIADGAPYDAEFALRTGLPNVGRVDRPTAVLIMADSLQEQGRWSESLRVLEGEEMPEGLQARTQQAMRITAQTVHVVGIDATKEQLGLVEDLLTREEDPSIAVTLLRSAEKLAHDLTDRSVAQRFLAKALELRPVVRDLPDRAMLVSSTAALAWISRRRDLLPRILDQTVALQEECRIAGLYSLGASRLANQEGCLRTANGDYALGKLAYERAVALAAKRLDAIGEAVGADNVAMCAGRLGDFGSQRAWAIRAHAILQTGEHPWPTLRILTHLAWSTLMTGNRLRAIELVERAQQLLANEFRPWIRQAGASLAADLLLACGERKQAILTAAEAIQEFGPIPLSAAQAGSISRWVAIVGHEHGNYASAEAALSMMRQELGDHDAFDRLEILAASRYLVKRNGGGIGELTRSMNDALMTLPSETAQHLRRMEMMT